MCESANDKNTFVCRDCIVVGQAENELLFVLEYFKTMEK